MAGINIGTYQPYYNPESGITGTTQQHQDAIRKKQEADQLAQEQQAAQQRQQQQAQSTVSQANAGYNAGRPSAMNASAATRAASQTSKLTGAGYSVDPYGYVSFDDTAAQARRTAADADARRLATLRSLMAQYGGADRDPAPGREQHRGLSITGDEAAARAAAFGRAKDQTGLVTRGAVDTLRNLYAGTGNVGAQRQGLENIVAGGAGALNEFTRDQLMSDLEREAQISDMTYQGGITQRGQDINRPFNPQLQALISLMGTLY